MSKLEWIKWLKVREWELMEWSGSGWNGVKVVIEEVVVVAEDGGGRPKSKFFSQYIVLSASFDISKIVVTKDHNV